MVQPGGTYELSLSPGRWMVTAVETTPGKSFRLTSSSGDELDLSSGEVVDHDVSLNTQERDGEEGGPSSAAARGTLGASFDNVNGRVTFSFLAPGSPAATAGLALGDELVKVNEEAVNSSLDAFRLTTGEPGIAVRLAVRRAGQERLLTVKFAREQTLRPLGKTLARTQSRSNATAAQKKERLAPEICFT